jgi:hypothetical protein
MANIKGYPWTDPGIKNVCRPPDSLTLIALHIPWKFQINISSAWLHRSVAIFDQISHFAQACFKEWNNKVIMIFLQMCWSLKKVTKYFIMHRMLKDEPIKQSSFFSKVLPTVQIKSKFAGRVHCKKPYRYINTARPGQMAFKSVYCVPSKRFASTRGCVISATVSALFGIRWLMGFSKCAWSRDWTAFSTVFETVTGTLDFGTLLVAFQ